MTVELRSFLHEGPATTDGWRTYFVANPRLYRAYVRACKLYYTALVAVVKLRSYIPL